MLMLQHHGRERRCLFSAPASAGAGRVFTCTAGRCSTGPAALIATGIAADALAGTGGVTAAIAAALVVVGRGCSHLFLRMLSSPWARRLLKLVAQTLTHRAADRARSPGQSLDPKNCTGEHCVVLAVCGMRLAARGTCVLPLCRRQLPACIDKYGGGCCTCMILAVSRRRSLGSCNQHTLAVNGTGRGNDAERAAG